MRDRRPTVHLQPVVGQSDNPSETLESQGLLRMKFLYVASERRAAEQAGPALRSVGSDVVVAWAATLGQARRWLDENRSVAALIVEVESDSRSFESLITHARGLGVKAPVIGIPLIGTSDVLLAVSAAADEVVPRNAMFLDELPRAVRRALRLRQANASEIAIPPADDALQRQLRDADALAARAEARAQDAIARLQAREESLQAVIEQERAARTDLERRLASAESGRHEADAVRQDAEHRRVREAAAVDEELSRRHQALVDATTAQRALEEKLAGVEAELEGLRRERAAAASQAVEEDRRLAAATGETQSLEQELADARRILGLADELHARTRAETESRVREIQERTDARLAEAADVTTTLQRELANTVVALRGLERRSSAEHAALTRQLADQESAREAAEQQAAALKRDFEARLAAADDAGRQLAATHASALATAQAAIDAAERRADEQHARAASAAQVLEARLAESVATADRVRAELSDAVAALAAAEQQAAADRQAAAGQLAAQQATFDAALANEATRRQALASELAERDRAHRDAVETLEAARQDLEERLAVAHDTRRQLDAEHAMALEAARAAREHAERRTAKLQTDAAAATQLLEARLAESLANADRVRAELSETAAALGSARHQAAADQQAAAEKLAGQQAAFDAALAHEVTRRQALATELAERDRAHRDVVGALEATRQDLEGRLAAAHDARRQSEAEHASALEAARAALEHAEQRAVVQQADAAAAARALEARLTESTATVDSLRAELSETAAALGSARQQAAAERRASAEDARRRQAESDALLATEVAARKAVETRLAEHQQQAEARATQAAGALAALQAKLVEQAAALLEAERQANTDRHEAAEQAARRQARFDTGLAEEVARRESVAAKLAEAEAVHQTAVADHAAALATARAQLAQHEQDAESRQAKLAAKIDTLQAGLAEATSALRRAEAQAISDRQAAAERAATKQQEFDNAFAREKAGTQALVQRLNEQEAARGQEQSLHASEIESWSRRVAEAEQQADARAQEAAATVAKLEAQLTESAAALKRAHEQAARERQIAAGQAAERRTEFEAALAQEVASRQALETRLFEEQGVRRQGEARFAADLAAAREELDRGRETAASKLAEIQKQHTSAVAAAEAKLAEQRRQAEAALDEQRRHAEQQAAELKRLAEARLAEAMTNAAATLEAAMQQAAADRRAAADRSAAQQAALEAALAQEVARREAADTALAALQTTSAEAERRFVDGIAAMRQQAADHDARLRERAARERSEWEAALGERQQKIGQLESEGERARQAIAASQARIQQLEGALADLGGRHSALERTFEEAKAAAQHSLEALSREHAAERSRLQAMVAERDRRIDDEAAQHRAASQAAAGAMAEVEQRLQAAIEAGQRDARAIEQLEAKIASLGKDREALTRQREALKKEADRVPVLQQHIDQAHADHRLRFDHTPVAMWRSRPDGSVVQANQALVSLLRYRTGDELLKANLATAVFESADELQWLIDRCLASRTTETVETTWRRKDGAGLVVRLMAVATAADAVDFVVIDITAVRALEEKLRNAQRMEAVARYASEVAATCNRLLGQVNEQGQQWLTRLEGSSARHQGELLFGDVTRASGFLNQLMVYGKEQQNAPELVEVKQVLRDLEPILRRVAGAHVQLVLPKASPPYNLDIEVERFERILVNVAAYGRERLPLGGRLVIEVSPVMVERTFVETYPNVRPGAHVLLTVSEEKEAAGSDWPAAVRDPAAGGNGAPPAPKPGVDLGALQALVADCGGHLWILAEPGGNMQLRIHLPRRVLDDRTPAKKASRGRWMSRLTGARHREAV